MDGGPPGFRQGFSCPAVLRNAIGVIRISHTGLSPSLAGLPSAVLLSLDIPRLAPYNPTIAETTMVWALPPSLAATEGISIDFSSSGYLDGSVPQVLPHIPMDSACDTQHYRCVGYPIRAPPDHRMFAPHRGFSQLATPFIAGQRQGIHHGPLFA